MAEYTFNSTEDTLLTNEFLSWSGDFDVDYNAIKLIAETIDEDPQLTMVEQQRVVQEPVEQPVSHHLIQPIVASQDFDFEQLVSSHHEEQSDSPQFIQQPVSPQFMELSPVSPQTIQQPVSPQFVQPVSSRLEKQLTSSQLVEEPVPLEFVEVPLPIVFVEQPATLQVAENSATQYQITVNTPMSVNDNVNNKMEVVAQANPQRRGRKPQNTTGRVRKPRRQPRTKVYQMEPFVDEEAERKRLNAVNAKRHRDMTKKKMAHLESQLAEVTKERDDLQQLVAKLQQNEKILLQKLKHQQQRDCDEGCNRAFTRASETWVWKMQIPSND
ncbi:hypothetical protein Pcinc_005800 [Petrolisthes cinctipes]|uniref:BZIP domain-containing protein n=1 Tax=Petrolisthes cinctipes TaxID=88211 RepID=A0AAE1GEH7_PETCI|nr:hypothetical protein Pcinc_005800 [Petrolisthes cinctipes]